MAEWYRRGTQQSPSRPRTAICYRCATGKSTFPRGGSMALSERRTDRVSLTLLLEASGVDSHGQEFKEPSRTMLINRTGAVILLQRELNPEQQIQLQRQSH